MWTVLLLLGALALAYDESVRRMDRARAAAGTDGRGAAAVWSVAAAIVLPPGLVVLLHAAVFGYRRLRELRPAAATWYRDDGPALLGSLSANAVLAAAAPAWSGVGVGRAAAGALTVLVAVVTYGVVSQGARHLLGARGHVDHLDMLPALCVGGLVGYAALHNPLLSVLALPPMLSLHCSAGRRELEAAATRDAKTGLLNAATWERLAAAELPRARRAGRPVAVLLIDIDRFKRVNDRFGHLAGDVALREVGRVLADGVREADAVGRFGGEEFVVLLPGVDRRAALQVAERVRTRVSDVRVAGEPLSVSIGLACTPHDGNGVAELLHAADAALYRAKDLGRNRVVTARPADAQLPPRRGDAGPRVRAARV
jgi:diguanylate cyclase (GGDEF)-like protein